MEIVVWAMKLSKNLLNPDFTSFLVSLVSSNIMNTANNEFLCNIFSNSIGVRRPSELHEKLTKENITEGTFEALELDTSSLESVKTFAEKILEKNYQIHVLINNAGIMFGPRKESTGT